MFLFSNTKKLKCSIRDKKLSFGDLTFAEYLVLVTLRHAREGKQISRHISRENGKSWKKLMRTQAADKSVTLNTVALEMRDFALF